MNDNIVKIKDYIDDGEGRTFTPDDRIYLEMFRAYLEHYYLIDNFEYLSTRESEPVINDQYSLIKDMNNVFEFTKSKGQVKLSYGFYAGVPEKTIEGPDVKTLVIGLLGFGKPIDQVVAETKELPATFKRPSYKVEANDGEIICALSHDHVCDLLGQYEFHQTCNDEGRLVIETTPNQGKKVEIVL